MAIDTFDRIINLTAKTVVNKWIIFLSALLPILQRQFFKWQIMAKLDDFIIFILFNSIYILMNTI
jgi:hypothetical protein